VSKVMTARAVREARAAQMQFAMLESAGIDLRDVGKVFNRAAPVDVPVPTSAAELEAMLGDPATMRNVFANPDTFKQFIGNYAKTVVDKDASIAVQVREETQRQLTAWLKENEPEALRHLDLRGAVDATRRAIETTSPRFNATHNPDAMGAQLDAPYRNMRGSGELFRNVVWHNAGQRGYAGSELRSTFQNAFSSTVPSEGGFLIPEVLRAELLAVALEQSVVRQRARVIPMETLRVPFPSIDTTSNVSSVYGGIVGYWTEEAAALTVSQAKFSRVVLDAKKLTAYTEVPNELIADSAISFQAFIDQIFPAGLAFYEDYAFMRGTGVGEPLGFINCAASVAVAAEAGQPTGTIVWENLVKMFARMLPSSLGSAVWIASIDTFPQLATMALSVGTGGAPVWLANGQAGPPMTILGRPVIFTEKSPVVGTTGDIVFADLGYYLIGDRQVMSAMSSEHYKFGNDVTAFRIIERVDGRPWIQSAITPKNGGSTLSPFVQIATR